MRKCEESPPLMRWMKHKSLSSGIYYQGKSFHCVHNRFNVFYFLTRTNVPSRKKGETPHERKTHLRNPPHPRIIERKSSPVHTYFHAKDIWKQLGFLFLFRQAACKVFDDLLFGSIQLFKIFKQFIQVLVHDHFRMAFCRF